MNHFFGLTPENIKQYDVPSGTAQWPLRAKVFLQEDVFRAVKSKYGSVYSMICVLDKKTGGKSRLQAMEDKKQARTQAKADAEAQLPLHARRLSTSQRRRAINMIMGMVMPATYMTIPYRHDDDDQ